VIDQNPAQMLRRSTSEPEVFAEFYKQHFERVLAYLARRVCDADLALELTAETFAQAYMARGRFRADRRAEVEELADLAGLRSALRTELQRVRRSQREALWLRVVEEFSYAEIAKMLNVPIGTVMSRISRGRRLLFERLSSVKSAASLPVSGGR